MARNETTTIDNNHENHNKRPLSEEAISGAAATLSGAAATLSGAAATLSGAATTTTATLPPPTPRVCVFGVDASKRINLCIESSPIESSPIVSICEASVGYGDALLGRFFDHVFPSPTSFGNSLRDALDDVLREGVPILGVTVDNNNNNTNATTPKRPRHETTAAAKTLPSEPASQRLSVDLLPQFDLDAKNRVTGVMLVCTTLDGAFPSVEHHDTLASIPTPIDGAVTSGIHVGPPKKRASMVSRDSSAANSGFGSDSDHSQWQLLHKPTPPVVLLVDATASVVDSTVGGGTGDAVAGGALYTAEGDRDQHPMSMSLQQARAETEKNMTAYLAHELRNPLSAIDSALAAMPDSLPETARSLLSEIRMCTGFMTSVLTNLLDVRAMEEGTLRLTQAPLSVRAILHNVHTMLAPSLRPGVDFRKLINVKGNDRVLGDAHRIQQVLTNVVSNAIRYTVAGHIQISFEWDGDHLKFICEDTGPGIRPGDRLFERFARHSGSPDTGHGYAIAKHIVDLTGGSIHFASDPNSNPVGTTCIVRMALPLCAAPERPVAPATGLIREAISVLLIDDIKMNRTLLKRRITKGIAPNAIVKEVSTGEDALLACATHAFDVMVVDQFMEQAGGVMVGTDVVFAMRRMRIDAIIIGCSGNDTGTQFFDAGADMVWRKPMPSNDTILRELRSALARRGGGGGS